MKKAISYIGRLFSGGLRPVLAAICGYGAICILCGILSRLVLSGLIPYGYIAAYSAAAVFFGGFIAAAIFGRHGKIIINSLFIWIIMLAGIIMLGAIFFDGGLDLHSGIFTAVAMLMGTLAGGIVSNMV